MYNDVVMERFKNPIHVGEIENPDAEGEIGNVKCGDIMRVTLRIEDETIKEIKFKTYGCVTAIVATDFLCDMVTGMKLDDAIKLTAKDIAANMGEVPQIKFHCSILAHNALKKAVAGYRGEEFEEPASCHHH